MSKPIPVATIHADGGCYHTSLEPSGAYVCVFDGDEDIGGEGDTPEDALDAARIVHHKLNTDASLELLGEFDDDDDDDDGEDDGGDEDDAPNSAESDEPQD